MSEADLHGLVDGHLDISRRADVLRRLAKAPEDRARVEAWQQQTDLMRAAFGAVEREPLPVTLDLSPKPRLRCISNEQAAIKAIPAGKSGPPKRGLVAGLALAIALSTGCILYLISAGSSDIPAADLRLPSSVDETLRLRTIVALGEAQKMRTGLPTLTIPDLETVGFTFVDVETHPAQPASLLFRYRNATSEILVISVARSPVEPSRPPTRAGDAYLWHSRDNTFAMAGTITPDRLRAIATALQSDDVQ